MANGKLLGTGMHFHQSSAVVRSRLVNSIDFRDAIIAGLDKSRGKFKASWNFLEKMANKLEYRRYGSQLIDILLVGGIVDSNGSIIKAGTCKSKTNYCLFSANEDITSIKAYDKLVNRLLSRYKYLANTFEKEVCRLLSFLSNFEQLSRIKLARYVALCVMNDTLRLRTLTNLSDNALVNAGVSLEFLLELFKTLKEEKSSNYLLKFIKGVGLHNRLLNYMPPEIRTDYFLTQICIANNLVDVLQLHKKYVIDENCRQLREIIIGDLEEDIPEMYIIENIQRFTSESELTDSEAIELLWSVIMSLHTQTHNDELSAKQCMAHVKRFCPILKGCTKTKNTQLALLRKVLEYCCDNRCSLRTFERIIVLLCESNVINNNAVIEWHTMTLKENKHERYYQQLEKYINWIKTQPKHRHWDYGRTELNMTKKSDFKNHQNYVKDSIKEIEQYIIANIVNNLKENRYSSI